jgi:endonuclease/exonuclease/phosphatase family metal-dependent hydrolase
MQHFIHRGLITTLVLLMACSTRKAPPGITSPPCRVGGAADQVDWVLRASLEERESLDAFCWAVGPPEIVVPSHRPAQPIDSLVVVSWNLHVGEGDLSRLIASLRNGELTGTPVRHFVVLLQEVHRAGAMVPKAIPDWSAAGRRTGEVHAGRRDVLDVAQAESLTAIYAPSMRNGRPDAEFPDEDRGNAILSTEALSDVMLLELPFERQRRIAVVASIQGTGSSGRPWTLRLASVHLDTRTRLSRLMRSLGAGRADQARAIVDALRGEDTPTVIGGDLNTWDSGLDAEAVRVLRDAYPAPADPVDDPTLPLPGPLPDLRLDYLFFGLPEGWHGDYRIVPDRFGSDHYPVVGWVRIGDARGGKDPGFSN